MYSQYIDDTYRIILAHVSQAILMLDCSDVLPKWVAQYLLFVN